MVKNFVLVLAVFLFSGIVNANTEVEGAISLIERICGKNADKGERLDIKIEGSGNAKTMKLISVLASGKVTGEVVINKQSAQGLVDEIERAKNIESNRACKMRYFDQVAPRIFDLLLEKASLDKECEGADVKIVKLKSRQRILLDNMVHATERQKKSFQDEYARNVQDLAVLEGKGCT